MVKVRFQQSKIQKLRSLLLDALLIQTDRVFIEKLINKLETSTVDKMARDAYIGLELLLDQDKVARAKTMRRFAVKKIDVFTQHLNRYTSKELEAIFRSCHLIQTTDGCTVACSWCYLNAQAYMQYAISYESMRRLLHAYARFFPDPTRLYWASDPLDWYDGEKSYVDLVEAFYKAPGNKNGMVTTTSLPMGTEFTFLRLLAWFDTHLVFQHTQTFVGDEQHYLKDSVMKGLFYNKKRKYDIHTLFDFFIKKIFYHQRTRHVLKISETDANYKRLKAILDIVKFMGISPACMSWIEVETRDVGDGAIRKSGRAYGWKDRDVVIDNVSMACWDSTILFPGKVGAMEMCGVTPSTQRGLEFWLIEPGKQVIPEARAIMSGFFDTPGKMKNFILPYLKLTEYTNGIASGRRTHYSLKRDIQAYGLLLSKTLPQIEFIANQGHVEVKNLFLWKTVKKQYERRKVMTDKLLVKEKDNDAVQIIRPIITRIEKKLEL